MKIGVVGLVLISSLKLSSSGLHYYLDGCTTYVFDGYAAHTGRLKPLKKKCFKLWRSST